LQAKADLITADERLANAMAARFPVKWLGAL
jgi:predicted nucleic acid-binding protein